MDNRFGTTSGMVIQTVMENVMRGAITHQAAAR